MRNAFDLRVLAGREQFGERVQLYIRQVRRAADGKVAGFSGRIEMVEVPEGVSAEPAARLELKDAQVLMDQLWDCGLRPTEGKGSAGCLAATEKHLADMRGIAFGLMGLK